MDVHALIADLDLQSLAYQAPALMAWELGVAQTIDEVAQYMYKGGPFPPQASLRPGVPPPEQRPPKQYWDYVKSEMMVFLCEDDKRYRELWKRIDAFDKTGSKPLIAVIAAYLGNQAGVPATLLTGFVAVVLYGAAKVGKEAMCRYLHASAESSPH